MVEENDSTHTCTVFTFSGAPGYIQNYFAKYNSAHLLQLSRDDFLRDLQVVWTRCWALIVVVPVLWNILPLKINFVPSHFFF